MKIIDRWISLLSGERPTKPGIPQLICHHCMESILLKRKSRSMSEEQQEAFAASTARARYSIDTMRDPVFHENPEPCPCCGRSGRLGSRYRWAALVEPYA